jgi:hypothetical protein
MLLLLLPDEPSRSAAHALASTIRKFFLPLSTLPTPARRRPVIES